jgi:catechol 2,3-dioxygenase-like lactoylglutathione lyase family enzyme
MSYVALATEAFDQMAFFYGQLLGFPIVAEWDRPRGRGRRYDLGDLRLEILDNLREPTRLTLYQPSGRLHIVIEVKDIDYARRQLTIEAPEPQSTSWEHVFFSCTIQMEPRSPFFNGLDTRI